MYVAAWPLLKNYPGNRFQSGLFGTWMFARNDGIARKGHYSDIEGGLGWWRDTRFATETPKFIMGGVALEFSEWANGPGAGKGRNWDKPAGHTKDRDRWTVVAAKDVPAETGLAKVTFSRKRDAAAKPYVTPDAAESSWKRPGPKAGPFTARLGDGSVATYYWYRFADQPALLNADLTADEREALQKRVELLHRAWTKEREFLPPPTVGRLADLDPAVLVTPPAGLEAGFVPIVTRQGLPE
jgi:hypothetical protein